MKKMVTSVGLINLFVTDIALRQTGPGRPVHVWWRVRLRACVRARPALGGDSGGSNGEGLAGRCEAHSLRLFAGHAVLDGAQVMVKAVQLEDVDAHEVRRPQHRGRLRTSSPRAHLLLLPVLVDDTSSA